MMRVRRGRFRKVTRSELLDFEIVQAREERNLAASGGNPNPVSPPPPPHVASIPAGWVAQYLEF